MPMPLQSPQTPAAPGAGPPPLSDGLSAQHDFIASQFSKTSKSMDMLGNVRKQLDELTRMGDSVQPEDVIESAGELVGAGMSPSALAQMLADMPPEGGQALAAWVQQHDQGIRQREAQAAQQHQLVGHHLAVSALHNIAGHELTAPQSPDEGPPGAPNALGVPSNG